MATHEVNGIEYNHAPNPTIQPGTLWESSYPPIEADTPYLRNKFTGEIVPNNDMNAERSDILEPYYGELPKANVQQTSTTTQELVVEDI